MIYSSAPVCIFRHWSDPKSSRSEVDHQ